MGYNPQWLFMLTDGFILYTVLRKTKVRYYVVRVKVCSHYDAKTRNIFIILSFFIIFAEDGT